MIERACIQRYADAVARDFQPQKIILFGSHAYGTATTDSDVDLLVVMPHAGRGVEAAIEIRNRLRATFALDLLVRSPERVRERLEMGDCFMQEILERGEVLYEGAHR